MFSILVMLASVGAASTDAGPGLPSPPSLQEQFNSASTAAAGGRCSEAVAAFEALETHPPISSNAKLLATIRARKAECLVNLWRLDEAANASRYALTVLDPEAPMSRGDVAEAHLELGKVAYLQFDYEEAARELETADAMMSGPQRVESLIWLARATMFDADERAISYADQALKLATTDPRWSKTELPGLHSLHARALLNHGQQAAAYSELRKVVDQKGGLTTRVGLDDLVIRADLAVAALLKGDKDTAREYLAYTGAGRFERTQFEHGTENGLPTCGGSAEIKPDDFAVVEFDVEDDGSVRQVSPIYASRRGPMAAAFARAISTWSWTPEDARAIPRLFRLVTRVEVRCSAGPSHPDELDGLHAELISWMKERELTPFAADTRRAAAVELARSELARRQSAQASLDQLPVLLALAGSPIPATTERLQWFKQARDLMTAGAAPIGALTYLDVASYRLGERWWDSAKQRTYLHTLLAVPAVAADARTAGIVRLMISRLNSRLPASPEAKQLLELTIADPGLSDHDPVKVASLLRLATLQAAEKDFAAAQASYRKTGLNAQQCSMFDVKPAARSFGSPMDFPDDALRWGFNGWVMLEFDVQADGKTANQRAIISYPPLVFTDAAVKSARAARYEMSYRPEGGLGCGSKQVMMNFRSAR